MYKISDHVVYNYRVCKIIDLKKINQKDYYVLEPNNDTSLKINVPVNNPNIRNIITVNKIQKIISIIPKIDVVEVNNKNIDNVYKELIEENSYESLIKIIKTAFSINKERINHNKKIRDKDEYYLKKTEELLYSEFSIALNKSYEETKKYVESRFDFYEIPR